MPCFITYQNIYCTSWQKFYILQWDLFLDFVVLLCVCMCYHIWKAFIFYQLNFVLNSTLLCSHTIKCLHGYAPIFLKNLINSCSVSERYSLRVNDNNWLLQTVTSLNFARSQSVFSCASPKIWNSLPLSLRKIETLSLFKKSLKAYYFNLASDDITTVWCQYFAAYCCRIST